jgi:hypothetical protein
MTYKTRTTALGGAGRTTLRFTTDEWADIEKLAEEEGLTWAQWATQAVQHWPRMAKHAAIRRAIAEAQRTGLVDRDGSHPFSPYTFVETDRDLAATKAKFQETGFIDCDTHVVRFGFGDHGPMIIVESNMKHGLHVIFAPHADAPAPVGV